MQRHNDDELIQELNEAYDDLDQAKADAANRFAGSKSAIKKGEMTAYDSERMKTLQSNKLPLILAGVGGALGALGWIAQTQWFKDLITTTVEHPAQYGEQTFTKTIENNLKVDPKGWSYTIQNNGFMDATGKSLNFNQPVGNLQDAFKFYGGGDQAKGIEAMSNFANRNPGTTHHSISREDPSDASARAAAQSRNPVSQIYNVNYRNNGEDRVRNMPIRATSREDAREKFITNFRYDEIVGIYLQN